MRKFLDLELAKLMLAKLNDHMLRPIDWHRLCIRDFRSKVVFGYVKFYNTIQLMLKEGYIERIDRGVYKATKKGKKLLEALENGGKNSNAIIS